MEAEVEEEVGYVMVRMMGVVMFRRTAKQVTPAISSSAMRTVQ